MNLTFLLLFSLPPPPPSSLLRPLSSSSSVLSPPPPNRIMCCVVGAAVNNDGARKDQFSQVSVEGQVEVLKKAYASVGGGCQPREHIGYIEGHGTGTTLGDPVEVAALAALLTETLSTSSTTKRSTADHSDKILLGSVKSNLGHLDAAAGAVGLLKVCLSLERGYVLPSIHFDSPSSGVGADLNRGGMQVSSKCQAWPTERPLAGCSSFGMGGTNVHLVLASASACIQKNVATTRRKINTVESSVLMTPRLFIMSAKNTADLCSYTQSMGAYARLQNPNKLSAEVRSSRLARSAFTLQCGQTWYDGAKVSFAAKTWRDVASQCDSFTRALLEEEQGSSSTTSTTRSNSADPAVIFMFPGQGSQHLKMAKRMYECEPIFRRSVKECCALVSAYGGVDVLRLFFEPGTLTTSELNRTDVVQPAVFIVSYCLAQLYIQKLGIPPTYMVGHSLGELCCAALNGVMDIETAISIVVERSRLMQSMPAGSMAQVGPGCTDQLLKDIMAVFPTLELAAHNTKSSYVLSGEKSTIKNLCKWFRERNRMKMDLNSNRYFFLFFFENIILVKKINIKN